MLKNYFKIAMAVLRRRKFFTFISLFAIILRKKSHSTPLRPEQTAIMLSINLVSVYFLIMGAFTPLWTYLPRIWSTYDSFDILSFLFPATVACLFGWLRH